MNLDLRDIPAIYINLDKDVERNDSIQSVLKDCGFKNIIRVPWVSVLNSINHI